MMFMLSSSVFAQLDGFRDERKVPDNQIPVAVRNAFAEEFAVPGDAKNGSWYIYFEQSKKNNGQPVITPITYIYRAKVKGEKIVISYNADYTFESAKGIARKEPAGPVSASN